MRIVELEEPITVEELRSRLLTISPRLRYVNNCGAKTVKTIGFCAGSGSEFIGSTDAFVTGDVKFHTALDAKTVVFDIGHFESEIFAPELLRKITGIEGVLADEKVLLFSSLFLLSTLMVFAYETIIIKFPDKELWVKAYYKKVGLEAILQYVPAGQGSNNWTKSVVVHSYNQSTFPISVF